MGNSGPQTGRGIYRGRKGKNSLPFNRGTAVPKVGKVHIEGDLEEQRPSL